MKQGLGFRGSLVEGLEPLIRRPEMPEVSCALGARHATAIEVEAKEIIWEFQKMRDSDIEPCKTGPLSLR